MNSENSENVKEYNDRFEIHVGMFNAITVDKTKKRPINFLKNT